MTNPCRVRQDELEYDHKGQTSDHLEDLHGAQDSRITNKVDLVMSGDDPELLMEVVTNEPEIEAVIMGLCLFDVKPDQNINRLDFMTAKQMASISLNLNQLIALKLREYVSDG